MNKTHKGQASFVLVLILGLVAMGVVLASGSQSVNNAIIEDTIATANKAWYAAWSGVDEIMYRLRSTQDVGSNYQVSLSLPNGATVSATVTGDNNSKVLKSVGYANGIIKRLEVDIASSSSKASFLFAVHAGQGGFELEGNASVTGKNNAPGNVYSNGSVLGVKASSGNAGSRIMGSVWANGIIGGLSSPDVGGVYIQKDAWANTLNSCLIGGNAKATSPPTNCPFGGSFTTTNPPAPVSLSSVDVNFWKNKAQSGGVWNGDCNLGAGNGTDCTNGSNVLGNIKIVGNLSVPSSQNVTINGPVWVKGDINISQNNVFSTAEAIGKNSTVIVASDPDNLLAKGRIITSSNVQFNRNSLGAGLIFVSENQGIDCANSPAIDITSNTATVLFVDLDGCINIGSNSLISGVLGKKIHIKNNSTVQYDPSLAKAIVATGSGGWAVVNIKEY